VKITLLTVGKTENNYLQQGIKVYIDRLGHYIKFDTIEVQLPAKLKSQNAELVKEAEGKIILKHFSSADMIILLDEKGKTYTSEEFATYLQRFMNAGVRNLMFVVGGAFGFSKEVYDAAQARLSLSAMTFSHQMVRLFFTEQLYRAFTIIRNEPYHNS